jgi:hypothetical protein
MQLLMLQQQMQERSQAYQAVSNVSKAEHEAAMSAIRNIK